MALGTSRSPRFTLRQLYYFLTAARTGRISSAATQVNISQSALTVAIADLERSLGTRLFERTRAGVVLTAEGTHFLPQAEAVLQAANQAARFPFHQRTDVEGPLDIAATYTVMGYFLLPLLARFKKAFPLVEVNPIEVSRPQIEDQIASGKITVAVVIVSNLDSPKSLRSIPLAQSRRQLWVAQDHPLSDRGAVTLDDVASYPYVVPKVDEGERNAALYWSTSEVQPEKWLYTSSMEALREMVALGFGVTILADMLFRTWSLDGRRITAVPLNARVPVMEIGLVWSRTRPLNARATALKEFLAMGLANPGAGFL